MRRAVLDREDVGDEERVVAGVRLGQRLGLDPTERALDQRRDVTSRVGTPCQWTIGG